MTLSWWPILIDWKWLSGVWRENVVMDYPHLSKVQKGRWWYKCQVFVTQGSQKNVLGRVSVLRIFDVQGNLLPIAAQQIAPKLKGINNKRLWSLSFCGSEIWVWLCLVLWSKVPHRLSPGVTRGHGHLGVHLILAGGGSISKQTHLAVNRLWLLLAVGQSYSFVHMDLSMWQLPSTRDSKRGHATWKPQSLCNLIF